VGVAVAAKMQEGLAVGGIETGLEPDLAGTALDLVDVVVRIFRQRLHEPAELDNVAIPLLPIVEQLEIGNDFIDCRQHGKLVLSACHIIITKHFGDGRSRI
jgi:hypothetical protein